MRKVGGSGTIGLTWSLQRNRRGVPKLTQLYFFQKKLGIIVETDYCGSFRLPSSACSPPGTPGRAARFRGHAIPTHAQGRGLGVVERSGVLRGRARLSDPADADRARAVLRPRESPAGRYWAELVEDNPSHPLRRLLSLEGGTEFAVGVSKLGKMTPEAAAATCGTWLSVELRLQIDVTITKLTGRRPAGLSTPG